MKLLVIFGIKIYPKLPSFLTIQKPNIVNRLSVSSFAATIKPPPFDGSNLQTLAIAAYTMIDSAESDACKRG